MSMTKNYFLTLALLLFSSASFAQQYEYKLSEVNSNLTNDYYKYFYDDANGRLDSTISYYELDGWKYDCAMKYIYDEKGNEILEKGYQKFEGDDFYTYSTQIRYTYDEQGRLTSRTNFNLDFDNVTFNLSGVYEYIYEGDKLVQRNAYWDEERTDKFEEATYTYDEKGRLAEENYYSSLFDDNLTFSNGTKYIYDDQDRMIEKVNTMADFMTGDITPAGGEVYTYDNAGNIVEWISYSDSKDDPVQRELYSHDPELATANTLYPIENEWDGTVYLNSKNAILTDTIYASDWYTGELGLYDQQVMVYTPVMTTGINTVRPSTQSMMQAVFDNQTVRLTGVKDNEQVRVYSITGLMMNMKSYNAKEGIDMSSMPSGAYIISTKQGSVKVWKK